MIESKRETANIFYPSFCEHFSSNVKQTSKFKFDVDHLDTKHLCKHSPKCNVCLAIKDSLIISDIKYFINAHEEVIKSKKFNFEGCRIPVNTRMNMEFIRSWLKDYEDTRLCDFLEFGFPIGVKNIDSITANVNKKDSITANVK